MYLYPLNIIRHSLFHLASMLIVDIVCIKCHLVKSLVVWFRYKGGREITAGDRYTMSYENAEASLTIRDTESNDSAVYMCSAANKLGTVDSSASLTVHGQCLDTCLIITLQMYVFILSARDSLCINVVLNKCNTNWELLCFLYMLQYIYMTK